MEQNNRKKEWKVAPLALFGLPILVALIVVSWLVWRGFIVQSKGSVTSVATTTSTKTPKTPMPTKTPMPITTPMPTKTPTATQPKAASMACNVKNYGATGNGTTKDTAAIQKTIDTCASLGGGTVEFPAGTFLTAPLFLKSNITLQVDAGATILGSPTMSDYTVQSGEQVATSTLALINAYKVNNIGITGGGVIDGQGSLWWSTGLAAGSRPRLVMLAHVNEINVTGVTLQNAGAMHLFFSRIVNYP